MNITKILMATVLGAIAMFAWTSIAHIALPLGEAGVQNTMNDEALLGALDSTVKSKPGMYFYPSMGVGPDASHAEQTAAMEKFPEKLAKYPTGFFIYHPAGSRPMQMGKYLTVEFITELCEAFLAVWLLAQTRIASFGGRVGFVTAAGVLAAIATNVSYWNWWGFPATYTASYMLIQVVGFFLVGVVAAIMFRRVSA
ncbi:MAG TPA: hypothetical protein VM940_04860 [Chthoniobacterales bacterium]|jgi:hypothetical protein|nr:hypothetical protein [Chthoniobacterales bacterium]